MNGRCLTLLLFSACTTDRLTREDSGSAPPDAGSPRADAATEADAGMDAPDADAIDVGPPDAGPTVDCMRIPSLPAAYDTIMGPISAEDFAFDDEGNLVGNDEQGNVVRSTKDGQVRVLIPNAGVDIAGLRFLPSGDLVYARVDDGTLYRATPSGSRTPVLSGFDYPNGIEVALDGRVYVAEQNAGRVRRVNPDDGTFDIVAEDLENPNGLSFSPDYRTLYVGSFGTGIVYAVDFDDAGVASAPRIFAMTPNAPGPGGGFPPYEDMVASCMNKMMDEPCSLAYFEDRGFMPTCLQDFDGTLVCYAPEAFPDPVTPCQMKQQGEACSVAWEGTDYPGMCFDDGFGFLYCVTEEWVGPGGNGGLDGMAVDACGYVYVTEYVLGVVWRISPDGTQVEMVFDPPTEWVPNMSFGTGMGGWDYLSLYVIDRAPNIVYEIPLGIPGKPRAFPRGI
jgi:sugar lactone lactonase YvrE